MKRRIAENRAPDELTPYHDRDGVVLYLGDVLDVLAALPAESVDCVFTSPPYWALRVYEGEDQDRVWGGDPAHDHDWTAHHRNGSHYTGATRWQHVAAEAQTGGRKVRDVDPAAWGHPAVPAGSYCECGAWRGQLGLEPTVGLYVEHTVEVLRAVRRVLKKTGVVWWNVGDSYISGNRGSWKGDGKRAKDSPLQASNNGSTGVAGVAPNRLPQDGLKDKDLALIPQRVALAAQADGWYVRSEVVWSKPNPMPQSAGDRPTRSHETVWLLSKSARYWWDGDAVREPATDRGRQRGREGRREEYDDPRRLPPGSRPQELKRLDWTARGRNIRSVWEIPVQPSPLPHFASFPLQLPERAILASCPPGGVVLDPFFGTGTTGAAARKHGRRCVGVEVSEEYAVLAVRRLEKGVRGAKAMGDGQGALPL